MRLRIIAIKTLRLWIVLALSTPHSSFGFFNALMIKKPAKVNLEVPIEMIDTGLESSTSASTFAMSRTSLDTTDYDGTVTYSFEVVASNTDSASRTVNLLDASNAVKASISVPAGAAMVRYRTTFTPTAGASDYRIQMPASTATADIILQTARILVTQVGATQTKIYYPLLSDRAANSTATELQIDGATGSSWFITPAVAIRWLKDTNNLASIATGNAWTLEAVIASSGAAGTAQVGLAQAGTTTMVTGSTASTVATTPTLVSASFANNATNFTDSTEFQVKVSNTNAALDSNIYRAGIWVKLTNVSKGVVAYRVSRGLTENLSTATKYAPNQRALLNTSAFSRPAVYFEDTSKCSVASCATLSLYDNGTNDSGTTSPTLVASSTSTPGLSYARTRSAALSITSGDRFYCGYTRASGTFNNAASFVIVTFGR